MVGMVVRIAITDGINILTVWQRLWQKKNPVSLNILKTHNSQFRYTKMSKVHCLVITQE